MKTSTPNNAILKRLVGTNWVAVESNLENKSTIEIVDEKYCIYSYLNNVKLRTYKINDGQICIGDSVSYDIRGNTFFYNDTPLYVKEDHLSAANSN